MAEAGIALGKIALREFARSLGDPGLDDRILHPARCGIAAAGDSDYAVTGLHGIRLAPGTRSAEAYGRARVREPFQCNHVLDPAAEAPLHEAGLRVAAAATGIGPAIFEWPRHPFFLATLFLPTGARCAPTRF